MIRRGFTLFEVAISLGILAVGITVILTLIPLGLRTQEQSRGRLLASIAAVNMVESFNNMGFLEKNLELEIKTGSEPWHSAAGRRSMSHDIEDKVSSMFGGFAPVPLAIARRLDSPDDEIQRILDEGGYIYYAQPGMPGGFATHANRTEMFDPPNESGKLVYGIVGYAQQNAVTLFAPKTWPQYSEAFGPPDSESIRSGDPALDDLAFVNAMKFTTSAVYPLPATGLPSGWSAVQPGLAGFLPYSFPTGNYTGGQMGTMTATRETAKRFFATAWWYAHRVMLRTGGTLSPLAPALRGDIPAYDPASAGGPAPGDDLNPAFRRMIETMIADKANVAAYVAALRAVGLAANSLARHYTVAELAAVDTHVIPDAPATAYPYGPYPLAAYPGAYVPSFELDGAAMATWDVPLTLAPTVTESIDLPPNVPVETLAVTIGGSVGTSRLLTPSAYVTAARLENWTEAAMHALMQYSAHHPYDWAIRRPRNRPMMMDVPLVQLDLFPTGTYSTLLEADGTRWLDATIDVATGASRAGYTPSGSWPWFSGTILATGIAARQWRWITPQAVPRIGRNLAADSLIADTGAGAPWGDRAHVNLTAPFHPGQRCRQIVVWAVDWHSYEDFETAPSAPVDASRYPFNKLATATARSRYQTYSSSTSWANAGWEFSTTIDAAMNSAKGGSSEQERPSFRNPEKHMLYTVPVDAYPTGRPMIDFIHGTDTIKQGANYTFTNATYGVSVSTSLDDGHQSDLGTTPTARGEDPLFVFSGLHGADRNNNRALDRGPTPPSVRLRATVISRFNFYDPRVQQTIR